MLRKSISVLGLAAILLSFGAALANILPPLTMRAFPTGFRSWFAVNSMIVTKDSAMFSQIGGIGIIYAE